MPDFVLMNVMFLSIKNYSQTPFAIKYEQSTMNLFSLISEKSSYQLGALIFVYSTRNGGFWMSYFLV
jgi:hypothetical protein